MGAGVQEVEHHAQREHVAAVRVTIAGEDLGRDEAWSAADRRVGSHWSPPRDAEVNDDCICGVGCVLAHHDVGEFDVAVHDAEPVEVRECLGEVEHELLAVGEGREPELLDVGQEVARE